ncbi:MAG: LysR family transcriptional regulator, partial [Acetobacteraceae bacterium]|nr:LysR family transcriptional regulator [Acetobacteraceae bacterium]
MDMRSLEVFSAVLRAGTATRAAELLRTSQPAVSRTLARLERAAGMALFVRAGGRLLPTEEALLLHREVEAAFRGLDRVREAAARIRERGPGVLRVACLPAMAARVAPRAVAAFRAAWPGVRVSLEVTDSLGVRDLVGGGRAEIGLAADEAEAAGLRRDPFAEALAVCAVPRAHPLASRPWVGPADLVGEPFLALAPEDAARR